MEPKEKMEVLFKYRRIWKSKHTKSETLKQWEKKSESLEIYLEMLSFM